MKFEYNKPVPVKALTDLRQSVGWNKMVNEYKNPLLTSYFHIAVYEDEMLIAYVDCVSNGVTDAYIQDLMICPSYQGKGLGTVLMNKMIDYLREKHIYMISVIFEESLKPFYEKLGFNNMLSGQIQTYDCD